MVGYSLGGLIARYAIGLLYTAGVFDEITPVNFTTFATPHLGTRTPLLGWNNHIFNVMGARTLSTSGQQLWLIDDFRKSGRPLLALLADPESIFMRALSSFKIRSLYANIVNDRAVPFYTACISPIDPFPDIDNLILNTIPDTEDVLLQHPQGDPEHNSEMATPRTGERTYYDAISAGAKNFWNKAPFYFFLTTLAPFGIMAFMANAGVQSVRSAQRIKDHEEGKAGTDYSKYKLPEKVLKGATLRAEKMFGEMDHRLGPDTLASGSATPDARERERVSETEESHQNGSANGTETRQTNGHATAPSSTLSTTLTANSAPSSSSSSPPSTPGTLTPTLNPPSEHLPLPSSAATDIDTTSSTLTANPTLTPTTSSPTSPFPTLALTPTQFEMIANLDAVGWRKYPVHITRANHSHAAIIVRMQRPGFGEGRVVSRFWCDRFEV